MSAPTDSLGQLDAPPPESGWLPVHLQAWEAAEVISAEQAAAIRELEDAYAEPAESAFRTSSPRCGVGVVERASDVDVVVAIDANGGTVIRHLIVDGEG